MKINCLRKRCGNGLQGTSSRFFIFLRIFSTVVPPYASNGGNDKEEADIREQMSLILALKK